MTRPLLLCRGSELTRPQKPDKSLSAHSQLNGLSVSEFLKPSVPPKATEIKSSANKEGELHHHHHRVLSFALLSPLPVRPKNKPYIYTRLEPRGEKLPLAFGSNKKVEARAERGL